MIAWIIISILNFTYAYDIYAPKTGSSVNLQILENEIKSNNVKSISSLLKILAEKYPTYMAKFVVVHRSSSLQVSSYENPRVIIFGEDASFVMSFNGSPEQRGYTSLEIMRYNFSKHEFFFHEISFEEDIAARKIALQQNETDELEAEILRDTKHLQSVTSPQICLTCHTPHKKPNWDPYPNWPGVYGALDDKTAGHFPRSDKPKNLIHTGGTALLAKLPTHSRYQYVPGLKEYIDNIAIQGRFGSSQFAPNLLFTEFLALLNFDRLFYRLEQLPDYKQYPKAVAAALYSCIDSVENFNKIYANFDYQDFLKVENDTIERIQNNRTLKRDFSIDFEYPTLSLEDKISLLNYRTQYGLLTAGPAERPFAHLRFFVENVLGDSMMFDSMSFNPGSYDFMIGSNHAAVARTVYLKRLAIVNPELHSTISQTLSQKLANTCEQILNAR